MGLANISIVGNVTRPPLQATYSNGSKTTLNVAVNSTRKADGTETTDFYRVEVWGKMGDVAAKYITKGHQITAVGRFYLDRWTDREGQQRTTPTIQATQISLPPKRGALEIAGAAEPESSRDDRHMMTEEEEDAAAHNMYGTSVPLPGSSIHQPASPAGDSSCPEQTAVVTPPATPPPETATVEPTDQIATQSASAVSIFNGRPVQSEPATTIGAHAMPFTDDDDVQTILESVSSGTNG